MSFGTPTHGRNDRARRAGRLALVLAGAWLVAAPAGCAGIAARPAPLRNILADWRERAESSRMLSGPSGALLERHGLLDAAADNPARAVRVLETRLQEQPEPNGPLALAELSYLAGLGQPSRSATALGWYRDAAVLAAMALAEPGVHEADVAIAVHNRALARLIRGAQDEASQSGRNWREVLGEQQLAIGVDAPYLEPERIADLQVAEDLRVQGMYHVYRSTGLGVPLVANRLVNSAGDGQLNDDFLPHEMRAGATAVVLAEGKLTGGEWRRQPASLMLFDPFGASAVNLGANVVALASDRTTPLATQVSSGAFQTLELMGLLDPGFRRPGSETGLYMLRPYEPGKIPIVFVHGLVSSPRAWAQTINELRNTPALSNRYQFWVFLYPTGLPIPGSAARLREALTKVRGEIDPTHHDMALDRMVLVGHSMGGILSKMMVQDTGLTLWNSTITVPYEQLKGSPELRKGIDNALVFRPVPSVKRVIFIASPHRGSPLANDLLGRVVSDFVRRPDEMAVREAELEKLNGPGVISRDLRGRRLNSVGNLRTDSSVLAALDRIPISADVPYHSIIPQIGGVPGTDGVVEYRSSHLEGAASERIVEGTHFSQGRPAVTDELRRVLIQHLEAEGMLTMAEGG